MDLLEYPLEALAFRYSAALAGSAWAWLAVAFAALGLWRIRAVGSPIKPDQQPDPPQNPKASTATARVGPAESKLKLLPVPSCHVEGDGEWSVTKGRFTAYFHVEGNGGDGIEEEGGDGVTDVDCEEEEVPLVTPLWKCEVMRGDLGWYRYVDLTAIDGSVVRLWDREREFRRRNVGVD